MLEFKSIIGQDLGSLATDIRDLRIETIGGESYVLSTTGQVGGIVSFRLQSDGSLTAHDTLYFAEVMSPNLTGQIEILTVNDRSVAVVASDTQAGLIGYEFQANGEFGTQQSIDLSDNGPRPGDLLQPSSSDFLFIVSSDGTLGTYRPDGQGGYVTAQTTNDSQFARPVDVAELTIGNNSYLIALNKEDRGVTSYAIDNVTGQLTIASSMGADRGLGLLNVPVALEVVQVHGTSYVIVATAASGGSSGAISVMMVTEHGTLIPTDHILDTLDTRFGQLQSLSVVEDGDWVYVIAGGGDDGVSLFVLMPGGQLLHLDTMVNGTGTNGLENVSAISTMSTSDSLEIFAASQSSSGLTQLSVSLSDQGQVLQAMASGGALTGSGLDDLLVGSSGSDVILAGDGNDILRDGFGEDTLDGGAGRDVFVLDFDQQRDRVLNFNPAVDELDLSHFPFLYDASQLDIVPTSYGALISWRGDETEVYSYNGQSLSWYDIMRSVRSGADRPAMIIANLLQGTANSENLEGNSADNTIMGYSGNDFLLGLDGDDTLDGGSGDDTLQGGSGSDNLYGLDGSDTLSGGSGSDVLDGGLGFDFASYRDSGSG
ncbi:hypothetical protein, partial [Parasulfitobacter algicola]|nr:hypothetical protein [Sulfitobacter algicola]